MAAPGGSHRAMSAALQLAIHQPEPPRQARHPQRIEEGIVEHVADGDTLTVIMPIQTKLCIRMFGLNTLHFRQHHYLFSAPAYRHEIRQQFQIFCEIKWLAPIA